MNTNLRLAQALLGAGYQPLQNAPEDPGQVPSNRTNYGPSREFLAMVKQIQNSTNNHIAPQLPPEYLRGLRAAGGG
jgi:hypothetical protein